MSAVPPQEGHVAANEKSSAGLCETTAVIDRVIARWEAAARAARSARAQGTATRPLASWLLGADESEAEPRAEGEAQVEARPTDPGEDPR